MTAKSAFGAGLLVGQLVSFALVDVLPRFLVPAIARRWL